MKITALIGESVSNKYFENYLEVILKKQLEIFPRDNWAIFFVCEGYSGLNAKKDFVFGLDIALEISLDPKNLVIFSSLSDTASLKAKYGDKFEELMLRENVTSFRALDGAIKLIRAFDSLLLFTKNELKLQE